MVDYLEMLPTWIEVVLDMWLYCPILYTLQIV